MADAVDMSLDDIIKQQRKNKANKSRNNNNNNNNNTKALSNKPRIKPKMQRRPITKTSPVKDKVEQMLHISNLHFGVSNKDLRELFEDIGPLKKAMVHYDKSGRSLGTAEVTFYSRDAAIKAINKYDQRHLDGRPMNIKLVPSRSAPKIGIKSDGGIQKRSPKKVGLGRRPQQGSQNKGPRRGGPNRGGKQGRPKQEVTAAQLDAELESYKEEKMVID